MLALVGVAWSQRDVLANFLKVLGSEEKLDPVNKTFFDLESTDVDGNAFKFSDLKQYKATLIFNSASL